MKRPTPQSRPLSHFWSRQRRRFSDTRRPDIFHAALINGISSHIFDFDDTHLRTIVHPADRSVLSAILGLAEYRPVSGADF